MIMELRTGMYSTACLCVCVGVGGWCLKQLRKHCTTFCQHVQLHVCWQKLSGSQCGTLGIAPVMTTSCFVSLLGSNMQQTSPLLSWIPWPRHVATAFAKTSHKQPRKFKKAPAAKGRKHPQFQMFYRPTPTKRKCLKMQTVSAVSSSDTLQKLKWQECWWSSASTAQKIQTFQHRDRMG